MRFYRYWCEDKDLISCNVVIKESDLYVRAQKNLEKKTFKAVSKYRLILEKYIAGNPSFKNILEPVSLKGKVPLIVEKMAEAAKKAGVGPMAAVAGAIAEFVGKDLLNYSPEVIIENGGDIFIKTVKIRRIGIYSGSSSFGKKIAIEILPQKTPMGICTSSGTMGHSLSLGKADAVVVSSHSAILADASATAIGNLIKTESDIAGGIELAQKIEGIKGVIIIKNDKMGVWGDIKICN